MPSLPLEDAFQDIIGKATRGLGLSREQLAQKAGLPADKVKAVFGGELDEETLRCLAHELCLASEPLLQVAQKEWLPAPIDVAGLAQFTSPFDESSVNAYVVWDSATRDAVIFDTGMDADELLEFIQTERLKVVSILLTHTHGDHIFELDRVKSKTGAHAFVGNREPLDGAESFAAGRTFSCGSLQIESRLTWGHSPGGITFVVRGLSRLVAIVGDAVFAGSMGGGAVSFSDAFSTNQQEIFTLPAETVLCPGHGPMTTVGEEQKHNPFYAEKE